MPRWPGATRCCQVGAYGSVGMFKIFPRSYFSQLAKALGDFGQKKMPSVELQHVPIRMTAIQRLAVSARKTQKAAPAIDGLDCNKKRSHKGRSIGAPSSVNHLFAPKLLHMQEIMAPPPFIVHKFCMHGAQTLTKSIEAKFLEDVFLFWVLHVVPSLSDPIPRIFRNCHHLIFSRLHSAPLHILLLAQYSHRPM